MKCMKFDLDGYHKFILEYRGPDGESVIGFYSEKRELASGRKSCWYFNGRLLLAYRSPLIKLSYFILEFCEEKGIMPDYFLNVPEGVNKLTDYLNIELGGKQVMVRAKPKEHGDPRDAYFIGPVEEGDKIIVVEDVTTTGGSLVNVLKKCLESELNVIATLCECNRMEKAAEGKGKERKDFGFGVEEYVRRVAEEYGAGTRHYALTDASKILPIAFELCTPPEGVSKKDIAGKLKEEYEDHGIISMDLQK